MLCSANCIGAMLYREVIHAGHYTILVGKKISRIVKVEYVLDQWFYHCTVGITLPFSSWRILSRSWGVHFGHSQICISFSACKVVSGPAKILTSFLVLGATWYLETPVGPSCFASPTNATVCTLFKLCITGRRVPGSESCVTSSILCCGSCGW